MGEKKRGIAKWLKILIIILIILVILIGILFYIAFRPFDSRGEKIELINPASGLSVEEAAKQFNESFVLYLLASIGAGELHNAPLSSEKPTIEIKVDEKNYWAEVDKGVIRVSAGKADGEDILIVTTALEAVKMMNNKVYIEDSFKARHSGIELKAGRTTLFGKGYLRLYQKLTGESVTGSFLRSGK